MDKKTLGIIGVALLVLIVSGVIVSKNFKQITPFSDTQTGSVNSVKYKNGEYQVDGIYQTPGGEEKLGVKLIIKDNIVTEVSVEGKGILPASQKFQKQFAGGYREKVIGKDISSLQIDRTSGSSLTPKGFNDALDKIRTQAKVS